MEKEILKYIEIVASWQFYSANICFYQFIWKVVTDLKYKEFL